MSSSLVSSLPSARAAVLCGSSVLNTKRGRFDPPFPPSLAPQPVRLLSGKGALAQRGESDETDGRDVGAMFQHLTFPSASHELTRSSWLCWLQAGARLPWMSPLLAEL